MKYQKHKHIDAVSRVEPQQKRRRRQQARGQTHFLPTVAAPEVVAETAARERRDPSLSPAVEDGIVTPSSAENLHTPRVGADATAPPRGGAATRSSTPVPVVALSSEGEAPAAPDDDAKVVAPSEQVTGASKNCTVRIETGGSATKAAIMRVKEELAVVKMRGTDQERTTDEKGVRKVNGGEDEKSESMGEDVMLPNETKRVGS